MTTNEKNQHHAIWIHRLYQLEKYLSKREAKKEYVHKIHQLALKAKSNELTIAFCGHFSAGKSSMINQIIGDDLLPSSPIPTSANIVALKEGNPQVLVTDQNGNKVSYAGEINIEQVKKASKDGEKIRTIEIYKHHPFLEDETVLMDTPGIDSTDDAHRISTESMLHLADVIIYVMDYNHVQSELNFNFTKEMQDAGKEVYLVINQIDKHNEAELPLTEFKDKTLDVFSQWGVQPKQAYFTSLKETNHTENDLSDLKNELKRIKQNKDTIINHTLDRMTNQLKNEYLENKYPDTSASAKDIDKTEKVISQLQSELDDLNGNSTIVEKQFHSELKKIIENARVMPYEVRELGRSVLESMQEGFKTGLFFSKKKTEAERQSRITEYVNAINEKLKTELEWHLKEELKKQFLKLQIHEPSIEEDILTMSHELVQEDVYRLQQRGATFNESYVLQYNRDVEDDLKKRYRRTAVQLFERMKEGYIEKHIMPKKKKTEMKLKDWKAKHKLEQSIVDQLNQRTDEESGLKQILKSMDRIEQTKDWLMDIEESSSLTAVEEKWLNTEAERKDHSERDIIPQEENDSIYKGNVDESALQLDQAIETLSEWPSLKDLTKRMKERSNKIKTKQFTVALFGAFSAGKSSFANAWLKDHVLPVSPNPTTATINKIMPVTDEHKHGTVKIQMKSADIMLEEINHSLQRFSEKAPTLEFAIDLIKKIDTKDPDPHIHFLRAVEKGYPVMKEYLGSEQLIDHDQFASFVAQEDRACFTESVELYYDCELTQQGITLVDTPGADSINARHTSVAFEYIKNADAIVFVTYYNHAFSKADRDFLIQLGRVKDTFSMDKMYFVINAADLAKDQQERDDVVDYVSSQLNEYGIRHPRMYALSSKQALIERRDHHDQQTSNFQKFLDSFQTTTLNERDQTLQQQADQLLQTGQKRLSEWIFNAKADKEEQVREKERLSDEQNEILSYIQSSSTGPYFKAIKQETEELLHYVGQRLMLTLNDEFKIAFNPSVLSNKHIGKEQLERCLDEFLDAMAFQLAQELRATTLRIEKNLNKQRYHFYEKITAHVNEKSQYELMELETISVETPNVEVHWSEKTHKKFLPLLKAFKNPKQFFEGKGRDQLREDLSKMFEPELQDMINAFSHEYTNFYESQLQHELEHLQDEMTKEIQFYYQGLLEAIGSKEQLEQLEQAKAKLDAIIHQGYGVKYE
ncbi:dynamin family protein [Pseudalkalibacillus berkeleyi]|uniref:Dynamin family protein n=1 Tax=Pseudalkalibacillus berkeleyi TaxID=1069813 RepID=A0ABS9H0E2_9BACL|nr:dynamin family protein [Pseudalkalibacillus berkeleyi]MCF6137257.1 dynamin family protein [Pseudalkalibacillus berkeleyi]